MNPERLTTGPGPLSVLVVDDDPGVRELLTHWIRALGYDAHHADSADAAIDLLNARTVDIALVDIMMPGRDGVWLIRQIQQRFTHTAIVIVTGLDAMDPTVTLSPGVVAYLVKPFDFDTIARSIDAAAARRADAVPSAPPMPLLTDGAKLH